MEKLADMVERYGRPLHPGTAPFRLWGRGRAGANWAHRGYPSRPGEAPGKACGV